VINPATEAVAGTISMGGPKDVDRAVQPPAGFRRLFPDHPAEASGPPGARARGLQGHYDEIAQAISTEMGAPITLAKGSQTRSAWGISAR